jgi:hypothetical protein
MRAIQMDVWTKNLVSMRGLSSRVLDRERPFRADQPIPSSLMTFLAAGSASTR